MAYLETGLCRLGAKAAAAATAADALAAAGVPVVSLS